MSLIPEACFFTGHRKIDGSKKNELLKKLEDTVTAMIEDGVTVFITGGALGFDTLAAQTVLKLRKTYSITLCLYIPSINQTEGWGYEDVIEYNRILKEADEVFYVSRERGTPALMKKRNRAMVEAGDRCVCYMNNPVSGTGHTVRLAKEKGIEVINLY